MTTPEVDINRTVLHDIAVTTVEGITGAELASAPLKVGEVLRQQKGARNPRALKVIREGDDVTVDLGLTVEYGQNLVKLAQQAQREVCQNIELMTGLKVRAVNVQIQGVSLPKGSSA